MSDVEKTPLLGQESSFEDYPLAAELAALAEIPHSPFEEWGATPLDTYSDDQLKADQLVMHDLLLEERFAKIPEALGDIPREIQEYVTFNFTSRFWGRTMANRDNYAKRLRKDEFGFDPAQREIFQRALRGAANPAELLYMQSHLIIPSVELGCITHPYGTHTDKLEEMRDAVRAAMSLFGAQICPEDELEDKFAIKQTDHVTTATGGYKKINASQDSAGLYVYHKGPQEHLRDAVVVTRKRDHGVLPDGNIVRERSSFIFRPQVYSEELAQMMRAVVLVNTDNALSELNKIAENVQLKQEFARLIKEKDFGTIIPLSTTIYSFNPETISEVERRQERKNAARGSRDAEIRKRLMGADDEVSSALGGSALISFAFRDDDF